ncbi:MAG: hypothetical protein DRQ08_00495 [Candidatus Latescibacterota bacterium]|nr:MAG: hypothetical protein DRQ08_00495 [Candidatus Latescibacterota bacterium]
MKVLKYAAVNARLRGMRSRRLAPQAIRGFLLDPSALRSALTRAGYPERLGDASLPELERGLFEGMARLWEGLVRFTKGDLREFLRALVFRLDLYNVHSVISAIFAGTSPRLLDTGRYGLFRREALEDVRDLSSLGNILKGTFLEREYGEAVRELESERDVLALFAALDRAYFLYLWELGGSLGGEDGAWCRRLLGRYGAVQDTIAFLRLRFVRGLGAREALRYLVGAGRVLPVGPFLESPDELGEASKMLSGSLLGRTIVVSEPSLEEVERALWRTFYSECEKAFRGHPFNIGPLLAQFFLLEREVKGIVAAFEGAALGLPEERTASFVV